MSTIDKIMALADIYARAWHANQSSRVVAAYDDENDRKALRAAIVELNAEHDTLRADAALWEERARHLGWRDEHEAVRKKE